MDPKSQGPEEHGHDDDRTEEAAGAARPARELVVSDFGQQAPALARTVRLVSGEFLLTVNPVDGSEIEPCRPGQQPDAPLRHTAGQREELRRAARPPVPPGPAALALPLLERDEERGRLVRLLGRGRSVRLSGPAGSGRSALLDAVAADCADVAPDGVVRLSGYHRTPIELLYDLFAAVHSAPQHRPDRAELLAHVREIGAIVVLDDLEFGGSALDEFLDATPECAFLLAATPDVQAPSADSALEEVFLSGLSRSTALELLERAVDRPLTDDEANWAGDLWFESEGLPLRFVQAGALLRQRDALRIGSGTEDDDVDIDDVFADGREVPLPTLGEGAAPVALLVSRLGESVRETLRFAVALGGEVPHQAHLPALIGDTHADAAVGELAGCALLTPIGSRYRLAAGVTTQLEAIGYAEGAVARAQTAAQHYAWWTAHPSVSPERAAAEADAILAAMGALVPGGESAHASAAVLLARSAAPAFAAGLHWGAWERTLRMGQEAARISGEVAEEAYFHHELGVLALCSGNLDRARAELEASIALRGALADKRGTVAGRRALALVGDRENGLLPGGRSPAAEETPTARHEESESPLRGGPAGTPPPETLVTRRGSPSEPVADGPRRTVLAGTRRNLVAAGAGALLAAVLGTVVTLGAASHDDEPANRVRNEQSAAEDAGNDGLNADEPTADSTHRPDDTAGDASPGAPAGAQPGESRSAGRPSAVPSQGASTAAGGSGTTGPSGSPTTGGTTTGSGGGTTTGSTSTGSSGSSTTGGTTTGSGGSPTTGGTTTGSDGGTTTGDTTSGSSGGATTGDTTTGSSGSPTTGGTSTGSGDTASGGSTTTSGGTSADGGTSTGSPSGSAASSSVA
ncbi:ATP-binding protein [Streptomyces sp. NPDC059176]|uniref:ATP-binding protein n=1 Tax=unclassified Streptomyces TaxID=2593676 RepID=UPI00367E7D31